MTMQSGFQEAKAAQDYNAFLAGLPLMVRLQEADFDQVKAWLDGGCPQGSWHLVKGALNRVAFALFCLNQFCRKRPVLRVLLVESDPKRKAAPDVLSIQQAWNEVIEFGRELEI